MRKICSAEDRADRLVDHMGRMRRATCRSVFPPRPRSGADHFEVATDRAKRSAGRQISDAMFGSGASGRDRPNLAVAEGVDRDVARGGDEPPITSPSRFVLVSWASCRFAREAR